MQASFQTEEGDNTQFSTGFAIYPYSFLTQKAPESCDRVQKGYNNTDNL